MIEGQAYPRQRMQFVPDRPFFRSNAVNFDGTNDYLNRGADLTGTADGKQLTFSGWVKVAINSTILRVMGAAVSGSARFLVNRQGANSNVRIVGNNAAGTTILDILSTANSLVIASGWVHILGSVDLSDTGKRWLYINDVSDLATVTTYTNDTIDFTATEWNVGANSTGGAKFNGDMAEIWFHPTYIDLSVETNRRKFITPILTPSYLGLSGEGPTGSPPLVYLSGPTDTWHLNKGSGGGFTENGALTDSTTSPSDP